MIRKLSLERDHCRFRQETKQRRLRHQLLLQSLSCLFLAVALVHGQTSSAATEDDTEGAFYRTNLNSGRVNFATFYLAPFDCSEKSSSGSSSSASGSSTSTAELVRSATEDCLRSAVGTTCSDANPAFATVQYIGLGNAFCNAPEAQDASSNTVEIRGGVMDFTGTPDEYSLPTSDQVWECVETALQSSSCSQALQSSTTTSLNAEQALVVYRQAGEEGDGAAAAASPTVDEPDAADGGTSSTESTTEDEMESTQGGTASTSQANERDRFGSSSFILTIGTVAGGLALLVTGSLAFFLQRQHSQKQSRRRHRQPHQKELILSSTVDCAASDNANDATPEAKQPQQLDADEAPFESAAGLGNDTSPLPPLPDSPPLTLVVCDTSQEPCLSEDDVDDDKVEPVTIQNDGSCELLPSPHNKENDKRSTTANHVVNVPPEVVPLHLCIGDDTNHTDTESSVPVAVAPCQDDVTCSIGPSAAGPKQPEGDDGYISSSSSSCDFRNDAYFRPHWQLGTGTTPLNGPRTVDASVVVPAQPVPKPQQPIDRDLDNVSPFSVAFGSASDADGVNGQIETDCPDVSDFEPDLEWNPDDNSVTSVDAANDYSGELSFVAATRFTSAAAVASSGSNVLPLSLQDTLSSTLRQWRQTTAQGDSESEVFGDSSHGSSSSNSGEALPPSSSRTFLEWLKTPSSSLLPTPLSLLPQRQQPLAPSSHPLPLTLVKSRSFPTLNRLSDFEVLHNETAMDDDNGSSNHGTEEQRSSNTRRAHDCFLATNAIGLSGSAAPYVKRKRTLSTPRKVYLLHNANS